MEPAVTACIPLPAVADLRTRNLRFRGLDRLVRAVRLAAAALFAVAIATPAPGAPVAFPLSTSTVRLDGVPLGQPLHPASLNSLRFTATFNPQDSLYHLWVLDGGDTQNPSDMQVADVAHATSSDGINFTTLGKLNPPASWWTQLPSVGATAEPSVNYLRVDKIGAEWFLTIWSPNEAGTGRYNYNANVWNIGANINNLNVVQRGPLPTLTDAPVGPGGNMVGSFGMVNGNLYLRQDTQYNSGPPINPLLFGGGMGRYAYTDATRPVLSGVWGTSEADLFTGTAYCWMLPNPGANQCAAFPASTPAFVHNAGRTLQQGAALGAYYTFRDWTTAARLEKQIYYVESADDGLTWTPPAGVYANGNGVLVDGLPNTGNFSSPEVLAVGSAYRAYFSTKDACGNTILVTNEDVTTPRGPVIGKSFAQTTLAVGGTTTLTVTVTAPAAACSPAPAGAVFTGLGFTDFLPAGVVLGTSPVVSNTCGGALTAPAGATSFGLAGAALNASASCNVTVNVVAIANGNQVNTIPRSGGGGGAPGFYNAQTAAAIADAGATLFVGFPGPGALTAIPTLSETALALLAMLTVVVALGGRRGR